MIDLRMTHLRSFLVLADELHFGRAASRLGIAQSALSAQVRRLEEEMGTVLLTRTSRSVALTAAGEEVRAGAERVLAHIDHTARRASAAAAGQVGVVRVGGTGAAMLGLIPRTVRHLREQVPELVVDVRELSTQPQLDAVTSGAIDVGFVRGAGTQAGLRVETVYADPVAAVLPASHPLAEREEIHLTDLAEEPFILWPRDGAPVFYDEVVAACHDVGFVPTIAYQAVESVGRQAFVAAGLGVGLESAASACARHRDVRFVPIADHPIGARIDAVWRDGAADPRRDLVLQAARTVGQRLNEHPRARARARRATRSGSLGRGS
jgi:DNA-binding transcriptional LysR family regulator